MGALGQVGVAVDPVVAVEVGDVTAVELALTVEVEAAAGFERELQLITADFDKWQIELIPIKRSNHRRPIHLYELKELLQSRLLRFLIKHRNITGKLRLGIILKRLHVLPTEPQINDEIGLPIKHERYHHDHILLSIGELQRILRRLNIESQNLQIGACQHILPDFEVFDDAAFHVHFVPLTGTDVAVDAEPGVVRDVVLADPCDELAVVQHLLAVVVVEDFVVVLGVDGAGDVTALLALAGFQHVLQGLPPSHEIINRLKANFNVFPGHPRQMPRVLQILLLNLHRLLILGHLILNIHPDLPLIPLNKRHIEVRTVFVGRFEGRPVLIDEVAQHAGSLLVGGAVGDCRAFEVGEVAQFGGGVVGLLDLDDFVELVLGLFAKFFVFERWA